jgi:hypothetical protein
LSCHMALRCLQARVFGNGLQILANGVPGGSSAGEILGFLAGGVEVAKHTDAWGDSRLRAFRRRPCRSSTRRQAYGTDAAERRTHFFRAEDTGIYAPIAAYDDCEVLERLIAQPAARGENLLVIEPPAPVATPEGAEDRPPVAPDLLAYAELRYSGTEQALKAAELLLPTAIGDSATSRQANRPSTNRARSTRSIS